MKSLYPIILKALLPSLPTLLHVPYGSLEHVFKYHLGSQGLLLPLALKVSVPAVFQQLGPAGAMKLISLFLIKENGLYLLYEVIKKDHTRMSVGLNRPG